MSDDQLTPQEQEEMKQIAAHIAESLANGKSQEEVTQQLVDNGWEPGDASQFVNTIGARLAEVQSHAYQEQSGGDGGGRWLVWIGAILLINLLSYLFGWGFWIY